MKLNSGGNSRPFGKTLLPSRSSLKKGWAQACKGVILAPGVYSSRRETNAIASGGVRTRNTCEKKDSTISQLIVGAVERQWVAKTNLGSQFLIIPGWKQKSVCFNLDVCLNFVSDLIYLLSLCLVATRVVRKLTPHGSSCKSQHQKTAKRDYFSWIVLTRWCVRPSTFSNDVDSRVKMNVN